MTSLVLVPNTPALDTPGGGTREGVPVKRLSTGELATVPSGPVTGRLIYAWALPGIPGPSAAPPGPTETPRVVVREAVILLTSVPTCSLTYKLDPARQVSGPEIILLDGCRAAAVTVVTGGGPVFVHRLFIGTHDRSI